MSKEKTMNTFEEIWNFFLDLWDTGNFWVRIAIVMLIAWPIAIFLAALLFSSQWLTAIVALIPLFALFLFLFAFIDPLVWAVVAQFEGGRKAIRWLGAIIGIELLIGVLLSIVPVGNDRKLLPLLLLSIFAVIFVQFFPSEKWRRGITRILGLVALSIVLIMFLGGRKELFAKAKSWWTEDEKPKANITESPSTRELPSLISLTDFTGPNPFPWCEGGDPQNNTILQDNPEHHIILEGQPCWNGYVTIPINWDDVTIDWEKGDKLGVWSRGGKMKIATSGKANDFRYIGRTFRLAGTGPIHLRPERIKGEWLSKLIGMPNVQTSTVPDPVSSKEGVTTGTLVQWYPQDEFIILQLKDGKEMKFKANRDTQINIDGTVYHLGSQGLLSTRKAAYPEPGDKFKVRYYESSKFITLMKLEEDVRSKSSRPSDEPSRIREDGVVKISRIEEKVIRGTITRLDEENGEIFLDNASGSHPISVSEETRFFIDGEECRFDSLRVEDIARAYFISEAEYATRIEVGTPLKTGSQGSSGDPFTNAYWSPSSNH